MVKKDTKNGGKNRGHYQGLYDRYINAAKESLSLGDKVLSEHNLQHAEHILRVMNEKFPIEKNIIHKKEVLNESKQNDAINTVNDKQSSGGSNIQKKPAVDSVSPSKGPFNQPKRKNRVRKPEESGSEKTETNL